MSRHRAKRSLGQHFLVDGNIQRKIVAALDPGPDDEVLEIGPGRGALTTHLAGRVGHLILVELDDRLAASLAEEYRERRDVTVVHGDVLKVDLRSFAPDPEALKVIGNIPYNVTAPIVFELLERPRPAQAVLMVQREVADRMAAPPGGSAYGALSVGVQSVARVEMLMKVPATAFRPRPRVESAVVRIVPDRPPRLSEREEDEVRALTRVAFGWRRKQFQRILRDHPRYALSAEDVAQLESVAGLSLVRRPETFSPEEFHLLSRLLAGRRERSDS